MHASENEGYIKRPEIDTENMGRGRDTMDGYSIVRTTRIDEMNDGSRSRNIPKYEPDEPQRP